MCVQFQCLQESLKTFSFSKFKGLGLKWKSYFSNIMFTKTEEDNPISAKWGKQKKLFNSIFPDETQCDNGKANFIAGI